MPAAPELKNLIGESFASSAGEGSVPSTNPSRPSETLALVPRGAAADVDTAVACARQASKGWAGLSGPARAEALYAWAGRIQSRQDELAMAMVSEVAKPVTEARGEVARCVAILRYFAGEAVRETGAVVPAQVPGPLQYAVRVPLGAVGLVTPWNFPLAIPLWKAAPALAMGNVVVLKPSEHSALCAHLLAETSLGLPSGVFQVVHGLGETVGSALANHPGVAAVSFTGSVRVGGLVAGACAGRNTKYQTEMGGKNAAVVLADADLNRAAELVAGGAMRFAGQKCTATSRVIVERPVLDPFLEHLVASVGKLQVGDVSDPATALGPVITEEAKERILSALHACRSPRVFESPARAEGHYVPPTVLGPVTPDDPVAQEELFGPVLAVLVAEDLDHALELANATPYGLSTAVFTRDIAQALSFVDRVEAGMVRVNGDTTGVDPHAPFGGFKSSSSGTREQGAVAKDFFTQWKTVQVNP